MSLISDAMCMLSLESSGPIFMSGLLEPIRLALAKATLRDDVKKKRYRLSASGFGQYFHYGCELYLRRATTVIEDGAGAGRLQAHDDSQDGKRIFLKGETWEQNILEYLRGQAGVRVVDCTGQDGTAAIQAVVQDTDTVGEVYLYQAEFEVPPSMLPQDFADAGVTVARMKPDFIRLQRSAVGWTLTVIDAKASAAIKASHQAQVTFYVEFMRKLVDQQAAPWLALLEWDGFGGVWLCSPSPGRPVHVPDCLELFQLQPWLQLLREELGHRLPTSTYSGDVEDVPWQLVSTCRSCPFLSSCRARGADDVRGLPWLTREDSHFLQATTLAHTPTSTRHLPLFRLQDAFEALPPGPRRDHVSSILGSPAPAPSPISSSSNGTQSLYSAPLSSPPAPAPLPTPPLLQSLLSKVCLPTGRPSGLFPASMDDVAIAIDLSMDACTNLPFGWAVAVQVQADTCAPSLLTSLRALLPSPLPPSSPSTLFLSLDGVDFLDSSGAPVDAQELCELEMALCCSLVSLLGSLVPLLGGHRVQVYVWDGDTRSALTTLLLRVALHNPSPSPPLPSTGGDDVSLSESVRRLSLLLLDSQGLWQLLTPPSMASQSQFRTSAELGRMTVAQLAAEGGGERARRGSKGQMVEQARDTARARNAHRMTGAPVICEVLPNFRVLCHLPVPGFVTASDVLGLIAEGQGGVEADHVEGLWRAGGEWGHRLRVRVMGLLSAKDWLRGMATGHSVLFNDSAPLPLLSAVPPPLPHPILQRLAFMKQADVIYRCQDSRRRRATLVSGSTLSQSIIQVRYLERRESVARRGFFGRAQLFHFQQLSGPPIFADMDAPGGFAAGSWLLTPPDPAAALAFLDLQHLTSFSYARSSGGEGDEGPMAFASVHDVRDEKAGGGEAGRVLVMELAQCPKRPEEGQGDRWAPIDLYRDGGRDRTFWLFDRVADRNVVKVLSALSDLPSGEFCALLHDPYEWSKGDTEGLGLGSLAHADLIRRVEAVNSFYNRMVLDLGEVVDVVLRPLRGMQRRALERLLTTRLTLVWGPPGTGKTHFAGKSLLTLIEAVARPSPTAPPSSDAPDASVGPCLRVLVTAFTHTAIDNLLQRVATLAHRAKAIPNRQDVGGWADVLRVVKLISGSPASTKGPHPGDTPAADAQLQPDGSVTSTTSVTEALSSRLVVIGATTWRLHTDLTTKASQLQGAFDVVVLDEASQLAVADALLPLACLKPRTGRLLVLGDSLQLAPIYALRFPCPPHGVPSLHTSFLECLTRREGDRAPLDLMRVVRGQDPCPAALIKLNENHRMNAELSAFTARLYGQDYRLPDNAAQRHAYWAVDPTALQPSDDGPGATVVRALLMPHPHPGRGSRASQALVLPSLVSIRLIPVNSDGDVLSPDELLLATAGRDQSDVEAAFVSSLMQALSVSHAVMGEEEASRALFACTPHRRLKAALREALGPGKPWCVDTVERVQGQERELVLLCLGVFSRGQVQRERDFLFSRERLNVALSRAQQCCIVVYTDAVLEFDAEVLAHPDANLAYTHLRGFVESSTKVEARICV